MAPRQEPFSDARHGVDTARRAARRAAVALVLIAAASGAACSSDPDPDAPSAADPLGLGEDGPGTCLRFEDEVGAEVFTLPVVPCTSPHTHEIYAVERYTVEGRSADVYPGFSELEEFARRACLAAFEPYVLANPFDSTLFHSWLVPTLDGWNDDTDREIICVLGDGEGRLRDESARDTGV